MPEALGINMRLDWAPTGGWRLKGLATGHIMVADRGTELDLQWQLRLGRPSSMHCPGVNVVRVSTSTRARWPMSWTYYSTGMAKLLHHKPGYTQGERTETINELKSLLQQVGACGDIWIATEFPRAVTALFFNYWIPVSSHIYFCYALVDGP